MKAYGKNKVPAFFYYAKNKTVEQCEEPNDSTMNRISYTIKDNRLMFKPIKNLGEIDYTLLLKNRVDLGFNRTVNTVFNKWNLQYGNMVNFPEDNFDYINRSNLGAIKNQIIKELSDIEPNEDKVISSLVKLFYEKPSERKKKLLWYVYGEQLYNNLYNNTVDNIGVCWGCGKRTSESLFRNRCFECRRNELKLRKGHSLIICQNCNKEFEVSAKASRRIYCDDCQKIKRKEKYIAYNSKR